MSTLKFSNNFKTITTLVAAFSSSTVMSKELPNFDFDALLMLDYDQFSEQFLEDSVEGANDVYIRRASLAAKSQLSKHWSAKLKVDVADGFELKDAYLKYKGWDFANITVGKHKEPFGLERQISSKNLLFTERSMVSNAIAPGRAYGVSLTGDQGITNWQLGYYVGDLDQDQEDQGDTSSLTGKISILPWQNKHGRLHLGASFSERSLNGSDFRINEKMVVYGADSLVEGEEFSADSASLNSIEFLWQYKGFTALGEWQQSTITADDGLEYLYDGGSTQLSYMLSGKNRKYKNGVLGRAAKKSDWELTARYNKINLHEENSEATALSLGVNYYINKDFKFSADYINANYIDNGEDLGDGNAISLRLQYQF